MEIKTAKYKVGSGRFFSAILGRWCARWAWAAILPTLVCLLLGVAVDLRYLIVFLVIVMNVYPVILMFVYYNYCLKPKAVRWPLLRRMTVTDSGIHIELIAEESTHPKVDLTPIDIPADSIVDFKIGKEYDTVIFGKPLDELTVVPCSAFSPKLRAQFHTYIYDRIRQNTMPKSY